MECSKILSGIRLIQDKVKNKYSIKNYWIK